jgi:tetratricopeptide (TPR) repeat protein
LYLNGDFRLEGAYMTRPLIAFLSLGFLAACGAKHAGTFEVGEATAEGDTSAATETADALWQERGAIDSLKAALTQYEEVLSMDPGNRHALERLARGYYFLGDGHLDNNDEKQAAWDTAINYGKQCLGLNADFRANLEKGDVDEVTAAEALTKADVPCTYWTASALGKWVGLQSLGVKLKNIPTVKAWIGRVEVLDSTYYYAATDRYWGAYWAAIPSFAGRDLDKSQAYFNKAIEAVPEHFGNRVLVASYWAEKTQDVSVFDENIQYVLSNCPNTMDGLTPEQEAEQRKAQSLLDRRDELFIDAGTVAAPEIQAPDCTPAAEELPAEEAAAPEALEGGAAESTGEEAADTAEGSILTPVEAPSAEVPATDAAE